MQRSNGFTLVELAIALMVIGLLIGGVLKGQELIENARITAFVKQFKEFDTAILIFRNTYGAYPGDIKKPGSRIPNCTEEICNIGGNGDGKIQEDNPHEQHNFFPHLTKAGMLNGPTGGTEDEMSDRQANGYQSEYHEQFFPTLPFGYFLYFNNNVRGSVYYVYTTTKQIARIDEKIDDGKPATGGTVRAEDCAIIDVDGTWQNYLYDTSADDNLCYSWIASEAWYPISW